MHKVSIIIPCYNQAEFLEETLGSVLKQTHTNWECLIVNDGSTDVTEKIAQQFISKDQRFKYFFKENGGLSSARNYGLDQSTGNYIQFLDSDHCCCSIFCSCFTKMSLQRRKITFFEINFRIRIPATKINPVQKMIKY